MSIISGNGWISLHRKLTNNWVWEEKPFSKGQAWVDILLMVNHKPGKIYFNNELVEVDRSERVTSEVKLAERWGWSRTKVRNFLKLLEEDNMLKVEKKNKRRTRLKVLKYNDYQNTKNNKKTIEKQQENNRKTTEKQQKNINNNVNNVNNVNNDNKETQNSASDFELEILNTFKKIDKYPFDFERDIEHIRDLMTDYPQVDILRQAKKWKSYKIDKPLTKKSNARLQFRNWIEKAIGLGQIKPKKKSEKSRIEKAKQKQIKRAEEYG